MNNPGHNNTFNEGSESMERQARRDFLERGPISTSKEWDQAAAEDRELSEAASAERVNQQANTIAEQIAKTAPEIDPLVALEARRAALQEEINGLEFDLGNRENSVSTNFRLSDERDAAEEALEQVEADIAKLTKAN